MKTKNPHRIPVTQASLKKAKKDATNDAIRTVLYAMLYVLVDKHNASKEELQTINEELNNFLEGIAQGYLNWGDIRKMLEDEYDVTLSLT